MEQEMELRSPPSPQASNCFPRTSLFKKDRIQERQRKEKQKVPEENDDRHLEEEVKQQELEIIRFREREERMKRKLDKIREKIAGKEQKTLEILQRDEHLKRELHAMKERLAQKEKQREEDKVTSKNMVDMIFTVNEEITFGPEKEAQRPVSIESKAEDLTSKTPSQVQTDGHTSGQRAEEKPERSGHDVGEAVIIEVETQQDALTLAASALARAWAALTADPDERLVVWLRADLLVDAISTVMNCQLAPFHCSVCNKDVGDTELNHVESATQVSAGQRMLQSVLPTVLSMIGRLRSHSSARHVEAEVENKCEDVSPPRPLVPGRTVETLVKESLFPCCPPTEETGTECRIFAAVKDCIQKRGRLLRLRRGLAECETGEDRDQSKAEKRERIEEDAGQQSNREANKRKNGCMQVKEVESTCSK
ncbi:hypothetical protein MHYP_G00085480 [Metynnis hypsauchen]